MFVIFKNKKDNTIPADIDNNIVLEVTEDEKDILEYKEVYSEMENVWYTLEDARSFIASDDIMAFVLGIDNDTAKEKIMEDFWINTDEEYYKMFPKNPLFELWKKFLDNIQSQNTNPITDRVDWWIPKEVLDKEISKLKEVDENLVRHFLLNLEILDSETNEKITENTRVYLNGIILWETNSWELETEFEYMLWMEDFIISLRNPLYGDAFIKINSFNSEWELLNGQVHMQKAETQETVIDSWKKTIDFSGFSLWLNKCSIVDKNWDCFTWEVKVKTNYITGEDVNDANVSLNMNAVVIDQNYFTALESGWMAFVDIIDSDWNILKVWDWKKVELSYNISDEDIDVMWDNLHQDYTRNWFWWYDKNAWIWKLDEDVVFELDFENKAWNVSVGILY